MHLHTFNTRPRMPQILCVLSTGGFRNIAHNFTVKPNGKGRSNKKPPKGDPRTEEAEMVQMSSLRLVCAMVWEAEFK